MAVVFKNNAKTTLASGITSSATSITVADGSVFPTLTGSDTFFCTLDDGTNIEIVEVTAISSNTLTVTRAQDNTSATSFSTGTVAELRLTAGILNLFSQTGSDINAEVEAYLDANGLTLPDSVKAQFGDTNDLQIFHTGADSIIKEIGTGSLYLGSDGVGVNIYNPSSNEIMAKFNVNSDVELYYNNEEKLATSSTGIDVTGTATMDGLTVDGNAQVNGDITVFDGTGDPFIKLQTNEQQYVLRIDNSESDILQIRDTTNSANRLGIANNGDISFYEDTGTTAKFFWDASAESLGIGTASPTFSSANYGGLHIHTGNGTALRLTNATSGQTASDGSELLLDPTTADLLIVNRDSGNQRFYTGGSERMRITSAGRLGLGTDSPERPLHIASATPYIVFDETDTSQKFSMGSGGGKFFLYDETDSAQRLTVDTSGNLLVGKTSANLTTIGVEIDPNGILIATKNAGTVAYFNRLTTDGTILDFRKDGSTVGSIGTMNFGDMYLGTDDTGIYFNNGIDSISPINTTNQTVRDNAIDLGASNARFKDLYLSSRTIIGDGSNSAPAYTFGSDADTGMYRVSTNALAFATGGTERWRITSSGTLQGSGTISSGAITSSGVSSFGSGTTVGSVELDGSSIGISEAGILFQPNSAYRCIHPTSMTATAHTSDISLGWSNNKWKDIYLAGYVKADSGYQIGTTTVIDSSRNLTNIGTINSGATTASGDIASRTSSYPGGRLILDRTASSSGAMTSSEIHFRAYGNNTTLRTFGKIEGRSTGYTDGQIMFYTQNSGTLTEALTIDSSQNATFAGTINSGAIDSLTSSADIPNGSTANLYLVDTRSLAANTGGSIVFSSYYQGTTAVSGGPYIKGYKENANSGDYGYGLKFGIRENGQGSTGPVFTLNSSGNAIFAGTINSGAITSSGNLHAGDGTDINMDGSANGQLEVDGNGYQGAIALNGSAMHIYHNSSSRDLVLGTNETARLTIGGTGTFTFHSNNLQSIGTISSGAITATGLTTLTNVKSLTDLYLSRNDGTSPAVVIEQFDRFRFITDSTGNYNESQLGVNPSNVLFTNNGYAINTTTVIDSSRNLTNIGNITSTGVLDISAGTNNIPVSISGSNSSYTSVAIKNTGSGSATLWMDASNGDLAGSDYASIKQTNSLQLVLRTEASAGSIILEPAGTAALTLDTSQNATFAGTINSGAITANAGTGVNLFYSSQTSTDDWQTSPISIRERGLNSNASTSSTYAPNLNFHWGSVVSRSLTMLSDGNFVLGEWGAGTPNTTSSLSTLNTGAYQINATTVIDSSRNLINIGTINSGAITSSSYGVFTNGNIDPDSFTSYAGGIGNIADGGGWAARGLFVHGGGTGDAAAIAHNGGNLYFGIQNGSSANSMSTWMQVSPAKAVDMTGSASVALPNTTAGAITSTGNAIFTGSGSSGSSNAFLIRRGSDNAGAFRVQNDGVVITEANYLYAASSGISLYVQNGLVARGNISNDTSGQPVKVADDFNVTGGYQANGTTVIDSSRNLTNIGTIAAGKTVLTGTGSSNTYSGLLKTVNTSSDQWGHITLGGSATNSVTDNYYLIGRGSSVGAREMSFHIPNDGNYGDSTQPKFRFASSGSDTLMTITAETGAMYVKGTISSGNISSTGSVEGTTLGVDNTSSTTKYGLALYGGGSAAINPTYGIMFTGTSGSGTHGSVTGNWATYFTMNGDSGRGWIFRNQTTPTNVASISNTGNATFNGTINSGKITTSNEFHMTGNAYLRSDDTFAFLTIAGNAQVGKFKAVAAQTSYANSASTGMFNALNGYAVGTGSGTTVIDSSRNLANIGTISTSGNINAGANINVQNNGILDVTTLRVRGDNDTGYSTPAGLTGGISLWSTGATTSQIMFKPTSAGSLGNHGFCTDSYNTYFVMDTTNRGWVFRNHTTATNIASISNTGSAEFNGIVRALEYHGRTNNATVIKGYNNTPLVTGVNGAAYYYGSDSGAYGIVIQGGHPICKSVKIGSVNAGTTVIDSSRNINCVNFQNTGGAKLEVQDSVDGGNTRGIFMWNSSDTNWGFYMSTAGAGKALDAGTACSGLDGRTSHGIRYRVADSTTQIGHIFENANDEALFQIQPDTGNIFARGNVTAYASDARLKTNIKTIENPIEKIKKIRGVEFDWLDNIEETHQFKPKCKRETGVIAQEIEEVIPDAISPAPFNNEYKTVEKDKIVALLIEAIKDQQKQIEYMKSEIKILKEKNNGN